MIASCARDVYEDLIGRFCRIGDSQFRKDTITRLGKLKQDSLRKRVVMRSKHTHSSDALALNMKYISEDQSENKLYSHLKLKSQIYYPNDVVFTSFLKSDLILLCKAYGIAAGNVQKSGPINQLCTVIPTLNEMPKPNFSVQNNPVVSSLKASSNEDTSSCSKSQPCTRKRTIEEKGKGKVKGKGKKKMETCDKDNTDTSVCSVYRRHYAEGEFWIQCDLCDEWFDWHHERCIATHSHFTLCFTHADCMHRLYLWTRIS
ncbi:hypothetical protein ACJMK2_009002 [Sinanodonta woodiana]|uniref:Zinc finger PHD-type domain-containing protein n=1 Tax=Sinanodonta woodiana TaxID=1069815 RepID=A0ABD3VAZ2_SINWO